MKLQYRKGEQEINTLHRKGQYGNVPALTWALGGPQGKLGLQESLDDWQRQIQSFPEKCKQNPILKGFP